MSTPTILPSVAGQALNLAAATDEELRVLAHALPDELERRRRLAHAHASASHAMAAFVAAGGRMSDFVEVAQALTAAPAALALPGAHAAPTTTAPAEPGALDDAGHGLSEEESAALHPEGTALDENTLPGVNSYPEDLSEVDPAPELVSLEHPDADLAAQTVDPDTGLLPGQAPDPVDEIASATDAMADPLTDPLPTTASTGLAATLGVQA